MAELKEPGHNNLWYGSPVQLSTSRPSHAGDAGLAHPASASPQSGRPRQSPWGSVDHPSPYPSYNRYSQDETAGADPYDRHPQQHSLTSHSSFASLKRPYSATEQPPYQEMVQDLRGDDGGGGAAAANNKLGVGHDHKLLAFRRVADKHAVVDGHGRMQPLELTAQLHGMFFLSELPAQGTDGSVLQPPELTCYRRNLFQVSGSLITPRGPMAVVGAAAAAAAAAGGASVPVQATEVTISAVESVDGHPVRLIVIPWKTPPPNSPDVGQAADQEPASLPLIPFQDDGAEAEGEYAVYPIGWRRLQFRIATANNGRRKELQQHFVVHLKVVATLADGSKVVLSEAQTAPIVVRGRSPRNFQARKEIPLLGSSAGSRGQALVETGLGIVAGPLAMKPQEMKARASLSMELPRTAFTFSAPKLPTSPMGGMRSNSYPTSWNPGIASNPPNYSSATITSDSYQKLPMASSGYPVEPHDLQSHLPASMPSMPSMQLSMVTSDHQHQHQHQQVPPMRTQYASYVGLSAGPPPLSGSSATAAATTGTTTVPRYVVDDGAAVAAANPCPSKSPRHPSQPSIQGSISSTESAASNNNNITNCTNKNEYRYGGGGGYGSISSASGQADTLSPSSSSTTHHHAYQHHHQHHQHQHQHQRRQHHHHHESQQSAAVAWTTVAGEASAPAYANGDHRAAAYAAAATADHYKPSAAKGDAPAPVYPAQTMSHYSWNAS